MPRWSGSRTTSGPRHRCWPWRTPWSPRSAGSRSSCEPRDRTDPTRQRARCPTPRRRSRSWWARFAGSMRPVWRTRRWPCCTASTRDRNRSRKRSRRRASLIRCATVRSCGGRAPDRCWRGCANASADVVEAVEAATDAVGFDANAQPDDTDGGHPPGRPRSAPGARRRVPRCHRRVGIAGYVAELTARFSTQQSGRGVNLLTFHRSKGLEWDAVFLPRLLDKELPFRARRSERPGRGTPAVLRRHHPGAPAPLPFLAAGGSHGAEPVPAGDRRGRQAGTHPRDAAARVPVTVGARAAVRCSTG